MNINAVVPSHFKFKVSSVAEKPYKVFNHSPPIWQVLFPFSPFQFSCFQTFKKNISLTCRHKFRKKMTKLQFTATWVIQQVFHKRCQTNFTGFFYLPPSSYGMTSFLDGPQKYFIFKSWDLPLSAYIAFSKFSHKVRYLSKESCSFV